MVYTLTTDEAMTALDDTARLLTPEGRCVLLDFGLSCHADYPDLLAEELRKAVGSPAWIAWVAAWTTERTSDQPPYGADHRSHSPRPARTHLQAVRRFVYQGSVERIQDGAGDVLQARETVATFAVELMNSDRLTANYLRDYELIPRPFTIATGVVDGYVLAAYAGSLAIDRGGPPGFFLTWSGFMLVVVLALALEPLRRNLVSKR